MKTLQQSRAIQVIALSLVPYAHALAEDGATDAQIRAVLPPPLARLFDTHAPRTSEVEWTMSWHGNYDDGLVERHVTRSAGDTVWQSNLGDENGYHRYAFSRSPPQNMSITDVASYALPKDHDAGTHNSLLFEGDVWHIDTAEAPWTGSALPLAHAQSHIPLNFGAAGLAVGSDFGFNAIGLMPWYTKGFESATFTTQRLGSIDVVTADFNNQRIEWQLDSALSGRPFYAALYVADKLTLRSETEYSDIDGRMMPTTVRFFHGDDDVPSRVVEVHTASFNKPEHMQEITPDDIGVLYGTQLTTPRAGGPDHWDGTKILSGNEYYELMHIYGIYPEQRVTEYLAKVFHWTVEEYELRLQRTAEQARDEYYQKYGEAPWLSLEVDRPDEWDVYVQAFIKEHELSKVMVKRARALLKRAKRLRDSHIRKNISKIRKAERTGNAQKLALFEAYTQRVFDKVLVRGLNRLIRK